MARSGVGIVIAISLLTAGTAWAQRPAVVVMLGERQDGMGGAVAAPVGGEGGSRPAPGPPPRGPARTDGWMFGGGVMFAGVAGGVEGEISAPLLPRLRVGLVGRAAHVFPNSMEAGSLGLSLTHEGAGRSGRFDFGVEGAVVAVD